MQEHSIKYRRDIDALRGISVLLVVLYHAFPSLVPGGYVGVDVFLVISGFLITHIIVDAVDRGGAFSLIWFYDRRIRRLFPSLLVVLLFVLVVGWLVLFPDEYGQLAEHVFSSALYFQNYHLIGEVGYFDVESIYKPLLHLWSLGVEEQYYVVWPFLLMLLLRQRLVAPSFIICFVIIVSFALNVYEVGQDRELAYYSTQSRIWQLGVGSLLGYVASKRKLVPDKPLLAVLGVGLILVAGFFFNDSIEYPGWWSLMPTAGAALYLAGGLKRTHWLGLVFVGLISYPLYLWHWVFISFATIYAGGELGPGPMALVVAASFVFAYLTYRYVEPLRYSKPGKAVPLLMLAVMLLISLAGYTIDKHGGIPDRTQLAYLDKYNLEFVRTPATDSIGVSMVHDAIHEPPLFAYCRGAGLDAERYIAVIGDSHAHAVFPGIAEEAKKFGYGSILLANSSCPPLMGFLWGNNDKQKSECQKSIQQIFRVVEGVDKIKKVVILTRGPVYIHGEVQGKFTESSVESSLNCCCEADLNWRGYFHGLAIVVERLEQSDHIKQIYYMLENPELDFLPKEVVPRPFDYFGISRGHSTMDKDLYEKRMRLYRDGVAKVAEHSSLRVIDPLPYMCDGNSCYSFKDGNFLYADDDHFSVFGAKWIAEKIRDDLFRN